MLTDYNLRFDLGGTSRNVETSLSDNYFDLGTVLRALGSGRAPSLQFSVDEAVAGPAGMTTELQILSMPCVAPARTSGTVTFTNATEIVNWTAHGLRTGDPVVFTGGTAPTGLTLGVTYYVIYASSGTFQVAATRPLALAGTETTFSSDGSGTITATAWPDGLSSVVTCEADDEKVTWTVGGAAAAHGFVLGTPIQLILGDSGVIPTGFTASQTYFVTALESTKFQLASTLANALKPSPTVVAITDDGTATINAIARPTVLGSSGPIPKELLTAKSVVNVRFNPPHFYGLTAGGLLVPGGRYVYGRIVHSSNAPTAGKFRIDLVDKPADGHQHHASGIVIN